MINPYIIGGLLLFITLLIGILYYKREWVKQHKQTAIAIIVAILALIFGLATYTNIILENDSNVWYYGSESNAYFHTNTTHTFSFIILNATHTTFNTTKFSIAVAQRLNITLMFINDSIIDAGSTDLVVDFFANTTSGTATFTIGGFNDSTIYDINKNGSLYSKVTANLTGYIVFSNSIWGNPRFQIYVSAGESPFAGGNGTIDDPYQITHIEHLYAVRNYLSNHFILMNDLDFTADSSYLGPSNKTGNITGTGWMPITSSFTGTLNGQNYTISNLFIDRPSVTGVGLFASLSITAAITNLSLYGVNVTGGDNCAGLIGYNAGNITNCSVTGKVLGENGYYGQCAGLLIGSSEYGSIIQCWSSGNVSITLTTPGEGCAGGLIGASAYGWINDSYSLADVCKLAGSGGSGIGAFIGYNGGGNTIVNCFSNGSVTFVGEADPTAQGFIGNRPSPIIAFDVNCYFDNSTSNQLTSRGDTIPPVGKNHTVMTSIDLFDGADWDITFTSADLNSGYPYLAWQGSSSVSTWLIYSAELIPSVTTNASTGVNNTNATLHGYLESNGLSNVTIVGFQYGPTTAYGTSTLRSGDVVAGGIPYTLYSFFTSNMTQRITNNDTANSYTKKITTDDTYIWVAFSNGEIWQFWNSNFTAKNHVTSVGPYYSIYDDTDFIYVGGNYWTAFSQFWKSNLTKKADATPLYSGAIMAIAKSSDRDWYDFDWTKSKKITIDHSMIDENLTNFPVFISLDDANLASAQADGDDFIFVSSDNTTTFNHEIEIWDEVSILVAWVNVTSVSSTEDTDIWMYYGNPYCSDQQNPQSVWDAHYKGVYHMDGANYAQITDSTSNINHATGSSGSITYAAQGIAGTAPLFNTGLSYLSFGSAIVDNPPLTLELWMKTPGYSTNGIYPYMLSTGTEGTNAGYAASLYVADSARPFLEISNDTNNWHAISNWNSMPSITNNTWYYLAAAWNGVTTSNASYHVNTLFSSKIPTSFSVYPALSLRMGAARVTTATAYSYYGYIDEVRISNVKRSDAWLNATYNSIHSPNDFITVGDEESSPGIFVGGLNDQKIRKYSTDTLTKIAETSDDNPGALYALIINGDYIYAGGVLTENVYQYWISNLTKKAESATYGGGILTLAADNTYLYAGGTGTRKIYKYWLSNLTKVAESSNYGGDIKSIALDDTYVYAGGTGTYKVYQYWKTNLTKKAESISIGDQISAVAMNSLSLPNGTTFTQAISGLSNGTLYHFQALATNNGGTGYGTDKLFLTSPANVSDFGVVSTTSNEITLSWTNGDGGNGVYAEYSANSSISPWNIGSGTKVNATGYLTGITWVHTSLSINTQYYYKVWAFAADSGYHSNNTVTAPFGNSQTADTSTLTPVYIRNNGLDYFVWLGANISAYHVALELTGFDELAEYISIFTNSGVWSNYYGDHSGTNWTIHTFDVVRTYLTDAAANQTIDVALNPNINYNAERTVTLVKIGNGYNYTGYTDDSADTLVGIDGKLTPGLAAGYFIGYWDRTTFTWKFYIHGFGYNPTVNVRRYGVITTKININQTWAI